MILWRREEGKESEMIAEQRDETENTLEEEGDQTPVRKDVEVKNSG